MKKGNKKIEAKPIENKIQKPMPLWVWLAGILTLSILIYLPAFTNGFTNWDDQYYVTDNIYIRSLSFQNILSFFTSLQTQGNYHPLTMLSLAIDYQLFGLNATGYHTINILLHLINSCLVFLLTQKLFKSPFITITTALLFAIHPTHVESVAWVSERKDVLYVLFYLLGLWCYVNYLDKKKRSYFIYTILCFVLSLLSKAQAVTFPLALLIIDYLRNGKISVKNILTKTPLLALSVTAGVIAIFAQQDVNATELYVRYTWIDRIIFTGHAIALYILKLFLPVNLAALYPYPDKNNGWYNPLVYLSLLAPIGFGALLLFFKKNRIVISGLLFFILNIALILQILPVGDAIIADRYTYLSYLGLFWVLGYALNYVIQKGGLYKVGVIIVCCCYVVFFSCTSYQRTQVWQSSLSLWQDELSKFNNVPVAWSNLGMIKEADNDPKYAKECFTHAISLDPDYSISYSNRSLAYIQLGQYDSAILDDDKALKLRPDNKSARQNRGAVFSMVGKTDSSLIDCDWLVKHFPNQLSAHLNHGLAYNSAQKYDSAIMEFNWVLSNKPNNEVAYASRGTAYMMLNKLNNALNDYNKAIELKPDYWEAFTNRAHIEILLGNNEKAIEDATIAIRNASSNQASNYITRAQAYYNLNRYNESLQDYLLLQKNGVPVGASFLTTLEKKAKQSN